MRWMCLVWAAALLMGVGIVKLMKVAVSEEPAPTVAIAEQECAPEKTEKPPE